MKKIKARKILSFKKNFIAIVMLVVFLSNLISSDVSAIEVGQDLGPNASTFESLLYDRHYVIDTFTGSSIPDNNPFASQYSASKEYIAHELLEEYEDNLLFRQSVKLYYYIDNPGDVVEKAKEDLAECFPTDASWMDFLNGIRGKNYNAVLNKVLSSDYESSRTGNTVNEELADIEEWRKYYGVSKKLKDIVGDGKDYLKLVNDIHSIDQLEYVQNLLPRLNGNIDKYLFGRVSLLNQGGIADNSAAENYAKRFDIQKDMLYGVSVSNDDTAKFNNWKKSLEVEKIASKVSNFLKVTSYALSTTATTLQDVMTLETMLAHRDSLVGTLERIKNKAPDNHAFKRTCNRYIDMVSNAGIEGETHLGKMVAQEALSNLYPIASKELWNLEKKGMETLSAFLKNPFCVSYFVFGTASLLSFFEGILFSPGRTIFAAVETGFSSPFLTMPVVFLAFIVSRFACPRRCAWYSLSVILSFAGLRRST